MCPRPVSLDRHRELALAAFDVIRERGVHNVTMTDLASALGLKRPTLYWYFRDLGHVFDVVFDHVLERHRGFVTERLRKVDHPVDRILAYGDAMVSVFEREGPMLLSLLSLWGASQGAEPSRAIEISMRGFLPLRTLGIESLRQAERDGRAKRCDAEAVIDFVAVTIDGYFLHRVARGLGWDDIRKILWDRVLAPLRLPAKKTAPPLVKSTSR